MTTSNSQLSKRAEILLGDLSGGTKGGLLNAEQANAFIDFVQDEPTLLKDVRVVRMSSPSRKIERMGFKGRILRSGEFSHTQQFGSRHLDNTANKEHAAVVTNMINLNTREVIAEVRLPYEVLEDNIERADFEAHVMREIARQVAQDLEELALNSDTGSGDPFLALFDGYLKSMTSHTIANGNVGVSPALFEQGMLAMPQKYLRRLPELNHYVSTANHIKYRGIVAQRATGYGDSALTGNIPLFAGGVEIKATPMLAAATESVWGAGDGAAVEQGIFTFPKNLIMGIQRDISVEIDKDISSREIIIVVTARVDFKIDDEDACVKYTAIG
jgi:hypothetical protein